MAPLVKRLPVFLGVPIEQLSFVRRAQGLTGSSLASRQATSARQRASARALDVAVLCKRTSGTGDDNHRRVGTPRTPCGIRRGLRPSVSIMPGPRKTSVGIQRSASRGGETDRIGCYGVQFVVFRRGVAAALSPAQRLPIDIGCCADRAGQPSRNFGAEPFPPRPRYRRLHEAMLSEHHDIRPARRCSTIVRPSDAPGRTYGTNVQFRPVNDAASRSVASERHAIEIVSTQCTCTTTLCGITAWSVVFDRRPQRRADQIVTDKFAARFASGVAPRRGR